MKNEYKIVGDIVIIYLKKRSGEVYETKIDLADLPKLIEFGYSWHASWNKPTKSFYARASIHSPRKTTIYLHQLLLPVEKGQCVDHIDCDTLNNTRKNLRASNQSKNMLNRSGINSNNSTGERNVSWSEKRQHYIVQITKDGKNKVFGRFKKDEFDKAVKLAREIREKVYQKEFNENILTTVD